MSHLSEVSHGEISQKLQVWCCRHCQEVHFKVGNILLNFSRNEFSELTHAVMEIYTHEFSALEFYQILNSMSQTDEVNCLDNAGILQSDMIA